MRAKYTVAFTLLLLLAAVSAYATADLLLVLNPAPDERVDPGALVTYRFLVVNHGPDPADVRLIHPLPPGGHFVAVNNPRWSCGETGGAVVCLRRIQFTGLFDDSYVNLTIVAPDDPAGVRFTGTTRLESDQTDPYPSDLSVTVKMVVYRTFTVTTPEDFGGGSLRDAIERSNDGCRGELPCKIRFAQPMRIAPRAPLPPVAGCDLLIEGGPYEPATRNRSFDVPRRVEISGRELTRGSGFTITAECAEPAFHRGPTLRALAIHSFPDNGIEVAAPAASSVTVEGCFIGTDAAGQVAAPNFRGISFAAPEAWGRIADCLVAGNLRSGIAIWSAGRPTIDLTGNLIGVRFGGAPLPNGASGVFINGGQVQSRYNAIEYNGEFGVAIGSGAAHFVSYQDYIVNNGGIAVDWGLDGPTGADAAFRMPPVPRLIDAVYDPGAGVTRVRGVLPVDAQLPRDFYFLYVYAGGATDFQGGVLIGGRPLGQAQGRDIPFEVALRGDWRAQTITALSSRAFLPDNADVDSSELSAAIVVR
jgi:hypothetical protein